MTEQIGASIKEARLAAGMTQKELAEAVDGLSASTLSKAERGLKELTDEQIAAIADATGAKSLLGKTKAAPAKKKDPAKKKASAKKKAPVVEAAPVDEPAAAVTADKEILELLGVAGPVVKGAVLSALKSDKGDDDPVAAITGMLGGILGSKEEPPKEEKKAATGVDKEIMELLGVAGPVVKGAALSALKVDQGDDDPMAAITAMLGSMMGGKG